MLTAGTAASSATQAVSYDDPAVIRVGRHDFAEVNILSPGAQMVTIEGSAMDRVELSSGSARLGFTLCEATGWASGTALVCKSPSGISNALQLTLSVGERTSTATDAVDYDNSVLTSLHGRNHVVGGELRISMFGGGFGAFMLSQEARVGLSSCEKSVWSSDTALQCTVTVKLGTTLTASVVIDANVASLTEAVTYDVAALSVFGSLEPRQYGIIVRDNNW